MVPRVLSFSLLSAEVQRHCHNADHAAFGSGLDDERNESALAIERRTG